MADATVKLKPLSTNPGLREQVYSALRNAISEMDIYSGPNAPKLDERKLAEDMGVSRTPIREAITRLEQEGLVETIPRKGTFVVRKTKKQIIEIIHVWAALEGMAARMATERASDTEIASMRRLFSTFDDGDEAQAHIDEYSENNISFHQRLIELGKCELLTEITDTLFIHMRAIRRKTIAERNRATESVIDHMRIIEALEARDAQRAERLVEEHAMYLATHVEQYVDYLD